MNGGSAENEGFKKFLLAPAENPQQLAGKKIAVLSTDGVEEIELTAPIRYLKERGAKVDLVAPRYIPLPKKLGVQYPKQRETHILTARFFENASWVKIDRFIDEVQASDYDAVIIPGGAWNPDSLRNTPEALKLVQAFHNQSKITAAICHGPLVFVNAGIIKTKHVTGYWSIQLDLTNAGANVSDEAVVVDGKMITSRFPFDLPQFMAAIADQLK